MQGKSNSLAEDEFGFKDLGAQCVSKRFKPTIDDMKLLVGTREWHKIKEEENIDENFVGSREASQTLEFNTDQYQETNF